MLESCRRLRLKGPFLPPGPLPHYNHCGYEVALLMVVASLEKGRHSESHKQWDTIRKIRSTYSNQVRAAAVANFSSVSLADTQGSSYQRLAADPCGSLWFLRFMAGCKKRMGQDWRPNRAISVELMEELLSESERRALAAQDEKSRHKWVLGGHIFACALCCPCGAPKDCWPTWTA
jgi:hypothetical protein